MKDIDHRQIQLAKEILESAGYRVEESKSHIDMKRVDHILQEYSSLMERLK